jgi:hypothetical protein
LGIKQSPGDQKLIRPYPKNQCPRLRTRGGRRWCKGKGDGGDVVGGGGVRYVEAPAVTVAVAVSCGTGAALGHSGGGVRCGSEFRVGLGLGYGRARGQREQGRGIGDEEER